MKQTSLLSFLTTFFFILTAVFNPVIFAEIQADGQANASRGLSVQMNSFKMLQTTSAFAAEEGTSMPVAKQMDIERKETIQANRAALASRSSQRLEQIRIDQRMNRQFVQTVRAMDDITRLDLRKPSGLSIEQADQILKGTGLEGLGKAFVEAEKDYQVNAYYLMAHAAWESNWGKSKLSIEKNNLFGFMAYDNNPYESAKRFSSKSDSVLTVAQFISEHYLSKNGQYYHGPNLEGMNVEYSTDDSWSEGIGQVMRLLVKKTAVYAV
jgi:beta-N-acetylglucosaminidase